MSELLQKACKACGLSKSKTTEFSCNRRTADGSCDTCKECLSISRPQIDKSLNIVDKESTAEQWRSAFLDAFNYRDGMLFWKVKASDKVNIGDRAGYAMPIGSRRIKLFGSSWLEHRVIFLMMHGCLPKLIDHIDGNNGNNRIENLRAATQIENARNCKVPVSNKSGYKNVSWRKDKKRWKVEIRVNKHPFFIGYFDDIELANLAAIEARNLHYGRFARHV